MNGLKVNITTAETADGRCESSQLCETFLYQSQQVAFAHQRIAQVGLVGRTE